MSLGESFISHKHTHRVAADVGKRITVVVACFKAGDIRRLKQPPGKQRSGERQLRAHFGHLLRS